MYECQVVDKMLCGAKFVSELCWLPVFGHKIFIITM